MAFENLFKLRNLKRTLPALAAGAAAVFVYLTAEHFAIIPATGALDEELSGAPALGERSIAIIPVAGGAAGGFAYPVAVELTSRLVRVPGIEVIAARTSLALAGPGGPSNRSKMPEIAWRLEIGELPADGESRVVATLFAGSTREPAWTLEQGANGASLGEFIEEVTAGLADQLEFAAPKGVAGGSGPGPGLYRDFLLARLLNLGGIEDVTVAAGLLEGVLAKLPEWAPGLAAMAHNRLLRAATGGPEARSLVQRAKDELEQAIGFAPELPEPYRYRSLAAHRFDWDWQLAYSAAHKALDRAPGDAEVLAAASMAAFTLGRFDEAVEQLRKAIALDPLAPGHRVRLALALEFSGRGQDAIDAFRALMVFDPDFPGAHARLARTLLVAGRPESALLHAEVEKSPFWQVYATALALQGLGREDEATEYLDRLIDDHGFDAAVQIAEIHAFSGRADQAFEWLARGVEQRDPGIAELIGNPLFERLHEDPRWSELLDALGLDGSGDQSRAIDSGQGLADLLQILEQATMQGFSFAAEKQAAQAPVVLVRNLPDPAQTVARCAQMRDHARDRLRRKAGFVGHFDLRAPLARGDAPEHGVAGKRRLIVTNQPERLRKRKG